MKSSELLQIAGERPNIIKNKWKKKKNCWEVVHEKDEIKTLIRIWDNGDHYRLEKFVLLKEISIDKQTRKRTIL